MFSSLPSMTMPFASRCTCHVSGSSEALVSGTAFGPGLIAPVTAFPSHCICSRTRVRCAFVGPQSPLHDPLSGWPYCAGAFAAASTQAANVKTRNTESRIGPPCGVEYTS